MQLRFFKLFLLKKGVEDVKIGVLSDLHIDSNAKRLAPGQTYDHLLAELLYNQEIDLLLLAGDVSSDYHDTFAFLDRMRDHNVSKIQFVPGNHDFWSIRNHEENTDRIYQLFKQRDENPVGNPFLIGDEWAVVGNPGWYDYGFASDSYTIEEFSRKKLKVGGWNDRRYVHWENDDRTVAAEMQAELENDLRRVSNRKIIMHDTCCNASAVCYPAPAQGL
jgi:putative phosphoesterase